MELVIALLALALLAALIRLLRLERDRRRALAALGAEQGPLPAAARRALRGQVDRVELSEALALRDAVMTASPLPVMLFDSAGRLVRQNDAARAAFPQSRRG